MQNNVAIIGFGGASRLGHRDIYKMPYGMYQLARENYTSNQRDWQVHGTRETEEKYVAVVDGFFMAVNTNFLRDIGGWKWIQSDFHCYDLAICLEAARRGWKVKMIGIDCTHGGGGTSTKAEYIDWLKERGKTPDQDHAEPHRWLYEEYRDQLPLTR